jgi:TonB family protein
MAAKLENTPAGEGGAALPHPDVELRATTADTIPPTSLKQLFASAGASVYVLSTDAELVDTVRRAGGQHYPVADVSEWSELELGVQTQRCGIAVLDADLLGAALIARINALAAHSRRVVVLVAAQRAVAQTLMNLLSDRKIHRLLIKPPALGITRLLIESAVNRWLQLRELANAAGDSDLPDTSAPRSKRVPLWVFATAGAALVAGVLAVVMLPSWWWGAEGPEAPSPAPAVVTTSTAPERVEAAAVHSEPPLPEQPRFADLLARAEQAFGAGRLSSPTGDNALDYYLVILAAEPEEPAARAGLGRVIEALFMQAEEALLADQPDAAAAALDHVRRADPSSSRLTFLEAQLARARVAAAPPVRPPSTPARQTTESQPAAATTPPTANTPSVDVGAELVASARQKLESGDIDTAAVLAAEAARLGATPAQLATLNAGIASARAERTTQRHEESLAVAASRIDSGALIAPEDDSALHHLTQLQSEAPDLAGLAGAWNRWRTAVVADVERALEARDWGRAEATLTALQRAPQGDRAAEPLRAELAYGRRQEEYLATAVPATELALIERVPVSYPPQELQRGIEGWVDIEFIVDREGRTRDLTVVAAEPRGRFDQAALTALRQYRYRPFEADGRVFERRVRLRTRFEVQQR